MVTSRKNCCRLCLAPEEECIPIFSNFAADRQRLDQKIFSCVQIKVLQEDDLSPKVCHACISYLNSWQSFKNRCDAAEKRQKSWIEIDRVAGSAAVDRNAVIQHVKELCPGVTIESIPSKIQQRSTEKVEETHMKHEQLQEQLKKTGVQISTTSVNVNLSSVKEEPKEQDDDNEERSVVMELDPSQFLIQSHNDDFDDDYDEGDSNGPQLLQSLGLHHTQNNDGMGNHPSDNETGEDYDGDNIHRQMLAACSVCEMTFSNRANARRHERNIHGLKQSLMNPLAAQVPPDYVETGIPRPKTSDNTPIISTSTGIPSIDLKAKFRMKLKADRETYDYRNPSKYRHLVTPNRLAFILRNMEFLEQAQEMKCKCCNKSYPSYKYFMGHMRKRYPNLPRNVCFKCLRQFGSKGQFIGHLKRKNCINLYAIVMADENISKTPAAATSFADVPGTNEVIANKSYGCKLCNKEFKPKINFRQHVLDAHPEVQRSKERPDPSCAFCQQRFEDAVLRRRHYNNLECLMFIVCCSCGERFEEHTAYVDHVYQHHLPPQQTGQDEYGYELFDQDGNSSSSQLRNPQNCPVCNKQYNNYYNVLRHMESKHPNQLPQIYQCNKCPEGFPRQSELKDHLQTAHGENALKMQKQQQHVTHFSCKECERTFVTMADWIDHQNVTHARFTCFKCDFRSEKRETFTIHCFMEHRNFNTSASKVQLYSCRQCTNTYNSIDSLQEHIESQHTSTSSDPAKAHSSVNGNKSITDGAENDSVAESIVNPTVPILKTINCGLCGFVLTDFEALRQHMSKIHGLDKKFYYCNQCTAKFMNDKGLRLHLFRAHGIRDESIPTPVVSAGASLLKPIQQPPPAAHPNLLATMNSEPEPSEADSKDSLECSVCHIVYRSVEQLKTHVQTVHETFEKDHIEVEDSTPRDALSMYANQQPHLWFQCRYCVESFNTSKRLTIHMNTHEEHDPSDHSCKDCGGIYSTKKSLWVHRYKKHPKIPDPSPCEHCPQVFFDKTELMYHATQAHVGSSSRATNGDANGDQFNDMQCASDALFSMLDTTGSIGNDNTRQANRKPEDTIYQCDMCPKTFHILNALQVHRGWHFRSPDGRKVRDPNDIWQPDQLPPSKIKRMSHTQRGPSSILPVPVASGTSTEKNPPTCPYCYSTFASGNNLKRHIVEVHKRSESKQSTQQNSPTMTSEIVPPNFIEKFRECTSCSLKFSTVPEWIDHKLSHARVQRPSEMFEWCCEICGKAFTRKERLLQHIISHSNVKDGEDSESVAALNKNHHVDGETDTSLYRSQQVTSSVEIKTEDEEVEDSDDEDEHVIETDLVDNGDVEDGDYEDGSNDSNNEDESEDEDENEESKEVKRYCCELCQAPCDSAEMLRKHVLEHFLIGGLGSNIQLSTRTSTDSSSSSNSGSSCSSSSKQQSSNNVVDSTEVKKEPTR